jgi:PPOX class probable F420-dependent enzyme
MADKGTPLDNETYISLESFKRDGGGVKTPVWSAPLDGRLVIFTDGTSYKVKRIGRNPKVRVAACGARGAVHGPWYDGQCRILEDAAEIERALGALRRKYGWQMLVGNFFSRLTGRFGRRKYLEVTVTNP